MLPALRFVLLLLLLSACKSSGFKLWTGGHSEATLSVLKSLNFCEVSFGNDKKLNYADWIQYENWMTDFKEITRAEAHCDNEELEECSRRIIMKRNAALVAAHKIENKYKKVDELAREYHGAKKGDENRMKKIVDEYEELKEVIRDLYKDVLAENLGKALHTVQDFYSHSSYVELVEKNSEMKSKIINFQSLFAKPSKETQFCPSNHAVLNTEITEYTSGYFKIFTPKGKCRHGFFKEGIHKDSPGRPRYHSAFAFAKSATKTFLNDIISTRLQTKMQKEIFKGCRAFPKLIRPNETDSENTINIAVDDTGSMKDDIAQVKQYIESRVTSRTSYTKFNLIQFNDPKVTSQVFYNRNLFLSHLRNLRVTGGGDCPEMMFTGIETLARLAGHGETLLVFTDASAKDLVKHNTVKHLLLAKSLRLMLFQTGTCRIIRRRRRSTTTTVDSSGRDLAELSGGAVLESTRSDVSDSITIANYLQNPDMKLIDFGKLTRLSGSCTNTSSQIVQNNVTVSILLKHANTPYKVELLLPDGQISSTVKKLQTTKLTHLQQSSTSGSGKWKVIVCTSSNTMYEIRTNEDIKFNVDLLQDGEDRHGKSYFPLTTNPVHEEIYNFSATFTFPQNKTLESHKFLLIGKDGAFISDSITSNVIFNNNGIFMFNGYFQIPKDNFFVQLKITIAGRTIVRASPEFTPKWLSIQVDKPAVELTKNKTSTINFTFINKKKTTETISLKSVATNTNGTDDTVQLSLAKKTIQVAQNSSLKIPVNVAATFNNCSLIYTTYNKKNIRLEGQSASGEFTVGHTELSVPCRQNTPIPNGCIYSIKEREACINRKQKVTIIVQQKEQPGGIPCPKEPLFEKCVPTTDPCKHFWTVECMKHLLLAPLPIGISILILIIIVVIIASIIAFCCNR